MIEKDIQVSLDRPQKIGNEVVSDMMMRRPNLGDLEVMGEMTRLKGEITGIIRLIARCAEITPQQARLIEGPELTTIMDALKPFLPKESKAKTLTDEDGSEAVRI